MSSEFIDGLHDDLVGAMERNERRRRRVLRPGLPRPAAVLPLVGAAVAAVAIVAGARTFEHEAPPARPHIAAVLAIGGEPVDAAVADGALWVGDLRGSLVEVDPVEHRVIRRIDAHGHPEAVAAGGTSAWTLETAAGHCGGVLQRYDSNSGRLISRRRLAFPGGRGDPAGGLAAAGDGLWVSNCAGRAGINRLGPAGTVTASVPLHAADGVAVHGGSAWAISHDGTLVELDAASGRERHRWRGLAPLGDSSFTFAASVLAPDRAGVWVLSTGRAAILRIEKGRVVGELAVDAHARPLLADAGDGLWIAAVSGRDHRLIRYDPRTRRPSATLELGNRRPIALVPSDDGLCVITGDGRILFVRG